ncbi:hypothetical protein AY599_15880 [Leptolyngbya valderiana BDU 20041]|nr:hypothetical protein AY599_15880 [Leptolyngbya valderiana BDU 20041]
MGLGLVLLAAVAVGLWWWFGLRESVEESVPPQQAQAPATPAPEPAAPPPSVSEPAPAPSEQSQPEARPAIEEPDPQPDEKPRVAAEDRPPEATPDTQATRQDEEATAFTEVPGDTTSRDTGDAALSEPSAERSAPEATTDAGQGKPLAESEDRRDAVTAARDAAEPEARQPEAEPSEAVREVPQQREAAPREQARPPREDQDASQQAALPPMPEAKDEERRSRPVPSEQEPEAEATSLKPSFDVVRIERDGSSVMAGRAPPNSEVVVRKDGREVARGRSDARGEFVILPDRPLPPGDYALELEAKTPAGARVSADQMVVVSIPEPAPPAGEAAPQAPAESAPLVVEVPTAETGPTRVLQLPEPPPQEMAGGLWLEAVDYDADGGLSVTGSGLPGQRVLVYLDNAPLGETQVAADGRWRLSPREEVAAGLYTLRIDQLDAEGAVTARVESPFARAAFDTADLPAEERFVVIQPGNNLWTIARRTYGAGPRYTVIFEANEDQIRDPDLIYPGQIFVLPRGGQAG